MPAPEPFDDDEQQDAEDPLPASMLTLLAALERLARRGSGPDAWAAPLTTDPVAFLLDATSDAVLVWRAPDRLMYANRAAEQLNLRAPAAPGVTRLRSDDGSELERRSLSSSRCTQPHTRWRSFAGSQRHRGDHRGRFRA